MRFMMEPALVEGFDLVFPDLVSMEDTSVLIFRALHIPAPSFTHVHQPLLVVSLRLWAIVIFVHG